jgi:hypothetical protein
MEPTPLPDFLERGEPARLIPVVSEGSKEQRAVSVLLATMQAVGEFGRALIAGLGGPAGKSSRIHCYTEVVLKTPEGLPKLRPDGLILVEQGSKKWSALVEAKIGTAQLELPQIEEYVDRAKEAGIDALVTISNQYAGATGGHPVPLDARRARAIALHHIPWMSLLTQAILLIEREGIDDTERAFIIREMIRFFQHEGSGVLQFSQMGPDWKELCLSVQQGLTLTKDSPQVRASVGDWMELSRYLEVPLSLAIRHPVSVRLSREHAADPVRRTADFVEKLVTDAQLSAEFDIPDAASRLELVADLKRRVLVASMNVKAPTDKLRAGACVTWILKQLEKCTDNQIMVRAIWPRRMPDTMATLEALRANREVLVPQGTDALPISFEVARFVDLGAKFKSAKAFVESSETLVVDTYRHVGQHLRAWQPAAPKVKTGVTNMQDTEEKEVPPKAADAASESVEDHATAKEPDPSAVASSPDRTVE